MKLYLQASNIKIAVAVIFPGDRFQQPVIPVQKAAKTATKEMMNNAMTERPISAKESIDIKKLISTGLLFGRSSLY